MIKSKRLTCKNCQKKFSWKPKRGRRPKYCSASCRQRAYEQRQIQRAAENMMPVRLLDTALEGTLNKAEIRAIVEQMLREYGIFPPPPELPGHKPDLKVVEPANDDADD